MNSLVSHIAYCTRVVGDFKRNITPMLKKNVDLRARRKSRNLRLRRITREKQVIFCVLANIVHGPNFLSFFLFFPSSFPLFARTTTSECRTNEMACSSLFPVVMREFLCISFRSGNLWNFFETLQRLASTAETAGCSV